MDEKTKRLRALRLAKESVEKIQRDRRKLAQQAAAGKFLEDLALRARNAISKNQSDPIVDRFLGIRTRKSS